MNVWPFCSHIFHGLNLPPTPGCCVKSIHQSVHFATRHGILDMRTPILQLDNMRTPTCSRSLSLSVSLSLSLVRLFRMFI